MKGKDKKNLSDLVFTWWMSLAGHVKGLMRQTG